MRVTKVQRRNDLPEKLSRLLRRQSSFFHQIIEELTAGHVFQHQVQVLLVLVHIGQAEHVRMVDQLHDGDFPFHLRVCSTNKCGARSKFQSISMPAGVHYYWCGNIPSGGRVGFEF